MTFDGQHEMRLTDLPPPPCPLHALPLTGDQLPSRIDCPVQTDVDGHQLSLGSFQRRIYRFSLWSSELSSLSTTLVS